MVNKRTGSWITILTIIYLCSLTTIVYAYNRNDVIWYAHAWSQDTGEDSGTANLTVYNKYGADCANFASQCLIAGGIRFRGQGANCTNLEPGGDTPATEIGTGTIRTFAIKNDNMKEYSRVVISANELGNSLTNGLHDGVPYGPRGFDSLFWDDVRGGDTVFTYSNGQYHHAMVITEPVYSPPKDLKYCAHTVWRKDHSLNDSVYGWKIQV
jgi:hypothetical protein